MPRVLLITDDRCAAKGVAEALAASCADMGIALDQVRGRSGAIAAVGACAPDLLVAQTAGLEHAEPAALAVVIQRAFLDARVPIVCLVPRDQTLRAIETWGAVGLDAIVADDMATGALAELMAGLLGAGATATAVAATPPVFRPRASMPPLDAAFRAS